MNKSAAVFDREKLLWVNAQHLKLTKPQIVAELLKPFLIDQGYDLSLPYSGEAIVELFKERSKTLAEMADDARFLFIEPDQYDPKGAKKYLRPVMIEPFEDVIILFEELHEFTGPSIQSTLEQYLAEKEWKLGKIAQPLRVAVTGKAVSPGIYEVLETLGKEKTLRRMRRAMEFMKNREQP